MLREPMSKGFEDFFFNFSKLEFQQLVKLSKTGENQHACKGTIWEKNQAHQKKKKKKDAN